ncbi:MAG: hypothetical protein DRJ40_08360 [Thermoprotei archaeon]|nr:MAG: hypothetical protein DRJ40_08360 [Thermoprotei archaeon]
MCARYVTAMEVSSFYTSVGYFLSKSAHEVMEVDVPCLDVCVRTMLLTTYHVCRFRCVRGRRRFLLTTLLGAVAPLYAYVHGSRREVRRLVRRSIAGIVESGCVDEFTTLLRDVALHTSQYLLHRWSEVCVEDLDPVHVAKKLATEHRSSDEVPDYVHELERLDEKCNFFRTALEKSKLCSDSVVCSGFHDYITHLHIYLKLPHVIVIPAFTSSNVCAVMTDFLRHYIDMLYRTCVLTNMVLTPYVCYLCSVFTPKQHGFKNPLAIRRLVTSSKDGGRVHVYCYVHLAKCLVFADYLTSLLIDVTLGDRDLSSEVLSCNECKHLNPSPFIHPRNLLRISNLLYRSEIDNVVEVLNNVAQATLCSRHYKVFRNEVVPKLVEIWRGDETKQ